MSLDEKSTNPFRRVQNAGLQGSFPPSGSGVADESYSRPPVCQEDVPQYLSQDKGSPSRWEESGSQPGAPMAPSYYSQPMSSQLTDPAPYRQGNIDPNQDSRSFYSHKPKFSYDPFLPIYLIAIGKNLSSGFPIMPPPSRSEVLHPFETHDVNEREWTRFLGEIASLGGSQEAQVHSIVGGLAKLMRPMSQGSTGPSAGQLVDQWNDRFFRPRKMEVILAQGSVRLSGARDGGIPSLNQEQERTHRQRSGSRSSSSSSEADSNSRGNVQHTLIGRKIQRVERTLERIGDRYKRKEQKREERHSRLLGLVVGGDRPRPGTGPGTDMKYRLFVVAF